MNEQSPVHEYFTIRRKEGVPLPNPFHAAHRTVNIRRSKSLDDSSVMLGTGTYCYVAFMDDERMEFLLFDSSAQHAELGFYVNVLYHSLKAILYSFQQFQCQNFK